MAGKTSTSTDKARAAFIKSGEKLSVKQMVKKYGVSKSTVYHSEWWLNRTAAQKKSAE